MEQAQVKNGDIHLNVIVNGSADSPHPPILCVHGWPELAHSWRNQLAHFAQAGHRIAAMDVRGYGESSKPHDIAAYAMAELCADVAAVIDHLGGRAILFGHDWGAPIVWQTAIRHPERVVAVAGLSVPYTPLGDRFFLDLMDQIHPDRFFYQLYFQQEEIAEAEFAADPDALLKIYWGLSGEGVAHAFTTPKTRADGFLTGMPKPDRLPDWLSADDLAFYNAAFANGGWRGPLNRYRAQRLDWEARAPVAGKRITQPAAFIAGALDPVRRFIPDHDTYANAAAHLDDHRGTTIIDGAGHWVQQEVPAAVNAALEAFVRGL
ncbi:alpha/beta fold hydrolase [uncultured Sphingomonas sp.]|uniref:alpha/beta fold hydrolase n=1 Tax=uncultured Sphingomonas sp. TaxID=158754 RepID=UPI0035CBF195